MWGAKWISRSFSGPSKEPGSMGWSSEVSRKESEDQGMWTAAVEGVMSSLSLISPPSWTVRLEAASAALRSWMLAEVAAMVAAEGIGTVVGTAIEGSLYKRWVMGDNRVV